MKRFTEFLKSKGFYIALGTGILAFAGLMIMYNYKNTKEHLLNEQAIDLNQPVVKDDDEDAQRAEIQLDGDNDKEKVADGDKTAPANSDSAVADTEGKKDDENIASATDATETGSEESTEDVPVVSDGAIADTQNEVKITASLEYDGEQSLVWPLVGDVILPYSMDTTVYFKTLDSYKCNPGMLIAAEEGASVFSAYEGVVSAIEDTKEYGTVVRVNLGNGYEAIYGQLMNVRVAVGDTVSIAQVIAEVGPVSSYYAEEGTNLYFAVTKDEVPVNPLSLIE